MKPTELEGWDNIIELSGRDNEPSRAQASARASEKQAYALANLGQSIFTAQKHISKRLDTLNERLESASNSTKKQNKRLVWLTFAVACGTITQAIVAIIK